MAPKPIPAHLRRDRPLQYRNINMEYRPQTGNVQYGPERAPVLVIRKGMKPQYQKQPVLVIRRGYHNNQPNVQNIVPDIPAARSSLADTFDSWMSAPM